jgi:hypothetical protein
MIKNFKWLLFASFAFVACNNDDEVMTDATSSDGKPLTAGSANFTKFVSLGNSLTAGFSDNALFIEGQKGSYTNILAEQFAKVGGGVYKIPFMNDNVGGFVGVPTFGPRLFFNGVGPVPVSGTQTTNISNILTGGFNNLGVPGAKIFHLTLSGYGALNPYFGRFASAPNTSVLEDAIAQNATFFSLWIGNNDVLSYATSGGTGVNQSTNINPATYGPNDITSPVVFESVFKALVNGLTSNGAKGVVANIPDVTSVPFFTAVPTNPVPGLPSSSAASLNQVFAGINAALAGAGLPARFVTLVADDGNAATTESNPLLIVDETLPNISAQITGALTGTFGTPTATFIGGLLGQARHAVGTGTSRDYILLTTRSIIGTTQSGIPSPFNNVGVSFPLQDAAVLTAAETAEIKTATDAFNNAISKVAAEKGLAFVDARSVLAYVANPSLPDPDRKYVEFLNNGGYSINSNFVSGGAFSLDGVHPSPRGYALIANVFLKAINEKYGSNFKPVDYSKYRIQFPSTL